MTIDVAKTSCDLRVHIEQLVLGSVCPQLKQRQTMVNREQHRGSREWPQQTLRDCQMQLRLFVVPLQHCQPKSHEQDKQEGSVEEEEAWLGTAMTELSEDNHKK